MQKKSIHALLRLYYQFDEKIMLVYRPDTKSHWADRCLYLSEEYSQVIQYNHRSMLRQEVVIEFDEPLYETNYNLAQKVMYNLMKHKIRYSAWHSGNKSVHVHCLLNVGAAKNLPLLKETFIRHMTKGLKILPDLQLCSTNHLIRAEYGIHEKTQKHKVLLHISNKYPVVSEIPVVIWREYFNEQARLLNKQATKAVDMTGLEGFKYIIESDKFRQSDDGRERALFMLIHCMKPKYVGDKEGLTKFLQSWYRYSSGTKLSDEAIRRKVNYHWEKNYKIGQNYLNQLLESIGRKDLVDK